jgi:hypothetical protein
MASIESVRASIDANIKTNGRQEITGVVMNAVLNNMVDLSEKNEGTLEEQKTLLNEQSRQIDSLEQKKANEDGKYPELTAGFANNLVGRGEAVDATINFRPSGGTSIEDGAARVKELKGNSVVWNQLAPFLSLENWGDNQKNVTYDNGTVIKTTSSVSYAENNCKTFFVQGHLYYGSIKVVSVADKGGVQFGESDESNILTTNKVGYADGMFKATTNNQLRYVANNEISFKDLRVIDLTQMFGEGNEPTTIEEFYKRIPQNVDLYAYNEGEVISTNAEGIKSVGFNAWDEEWELGSYDYLSGVKESSANGIRCKNFISVFGNTSYYCHNGSYVGQNETIVIFYNRHQEYIKYIASGNTFFTTPEDARYITFIHLALPTTTTSASTFPILATETESISRICSSSETLTHASERHSLTD